MSGQCGAQLAADADQSAFVRHAAAPIPEKKFRDQDAVYGWWIGPFVRIGLAGIGPATGSTRTS
jgi:hypothetical protein